MWAKLGVTCGQFAVCTSSGEEQPVDKFWVMHRAKNNLWTMRTILYKLSGC